MNKTDERCCAPVMLTPTLEAYIEVDDDEDPCACDRYAPVMLTPTLEAYIEVDDDEDPCDFGCAQW